MSAVVHPIGENPRLRITRLVKLLVERQEQQRAARQFLDAIEHTASPTKRIAYALDARLVLHLEAVPVEVLAEHRQAALLRVVKEQGGRWKSGRARRVYRALGYGTLSKSTASHDLKALRSAGHLVQHDVDGVRFFTLDGGAR